jgi:hypothetical protein
MVATSLFVGSDRPPFCLEVKAHRCSNASNPNVEKAGSGRHFIHLGIAAAASVGQPRQLDTTMWPPPKSSWRNISHLFLPCHTHFDAIFPQRLILSSLKMSTELQKTYCLHVLGRVNTATSKTTRSPTSSTLVVTMAILHLVNNGSILSRDLATVSDPDDLNKRVFQYNTLLGGGTTILGLEAPPTCLNTR